MRGTHTYASFSVLLLMLLACTSGDHDAGDGAARDACAGGPADPGPVSSYPCPSGKPNLRPQDGVCPAGYFPNLDVSCGRVFPPDGATGYACECSESGDRACEKLCACDADCPPGKRCARRDLMWGDDYPRAQVNVCR